MTKTSGTIAVGRPKVRGRAARTNDTGRFEPYSRVAVDDGWPAEEDPQPLRTELALETPRGIITRNTSPDIPFDRSINPYRGCEHGCIYCFARPSHAWLGLSPGLDFETRLVAKPNAAAVLRATLARPGYRPKPIAIGTNTDPYQPVEARMRIMRSILEVLSGQGHPVTIVTKGSLIERDIDILAELAGRGLAHVGISVTGLDPRLSRSMEPRAPAPARRLQVIGRLAAAGIPVRVMVAPVVPGLTDHEIEPILAEARAAGADAASWIMLRLPLEVAPLFEEWLLATRPERAKKVMGRVRDTHGGRTYDPAWGRRMTGEGVYAEMIGRRFALARRRLGFNRDLPPLRCDLFRPPSRDDRQMSLF